MTALFITDIHGRADRIAGLPRADMLIVGGDITHFGTGYEAVALLEQAADRYARILAVPGNCDAPDTARALDARGWGMHLEPILIDGTLFLGIGGSNPTPAFTPWEWDESGMEKEIEPGLETAAQQPAVCRVLVSHAPPLGSGADRLPSGRHVGSRTVAGAARTLGADLVLCGHIHEARGVFSWDGRTVVNPGPFRDGWYCRVDLQPDRLPDIQILRTGMVC